MGAPIKVGPGDKANLHAMTIICATTRYMYFAFLKACVDHNSMQELHPYKINRMTSLMHH